MIWNKTRRILKTCNKTVILIYMVLLSLRTSPYLTSLESKITSHKSRQFTQHHYTSHHFTYFHLIPTWILLFVTTFLTPFLTVFSFQGEDDSKPAGNWFRLVTVRFTKEYQLTMKLQTRYSTLSWHKIIL
jgi:hypothetical protein